MKISVTPEDLVRRCLWDHYVYYIVGSDKEAEKILKENVEFEVSEREALVIGLLKVIETDNLIHKYNTYIEKFLYQLKQCLQNNNNNYFKSCEIISQKNTDAKIGIQDMFDIPLFEICTKLINLKFIVYRHADYNQNLFIDWIVFYKFFSLVNYRLISIIGICFY